MVSEDRTRSRPWIPAHTRRASGRTLERGKDTRRRLAGAMPLVLFSSYVSTRPDHASGAGRPATPKTLFARPWSCLPPQGSSRNTPVIAAQAASPKVRSTGFPSKQQLLNDVYRSAVGMCTWAGLFPGHSSRLPCDGAGKMGGLVARSRRSRAPGSTGFCRAGAQPARPTSGMHGELRSELETCIATGKAPATSVPSPLTLGGYLAQLCPDLGGSPQDGLRINPRPAGCGERVASTDSRREAYTPCTSDVRRRRVLLRLASSSPLPRRPPPRCGPDALQIHRVTLRPSSTPRNQSGPACRPTQKATGSTTLASAVVRAWPPMGTCRGGITGPSPALTGPPLDACRRTRPHIVPVVDRR